LNSLQYLPSLFPYALETMKIQDCELDNLDSNSTNTIFDIPIENTAVKLLELIIHQEQLHEDSANWNKSNNILVIATFPTTVKCYIVENNGKYVQDLTADTFDTEFAKGGTRKIKINLMAQSIQTFKFSISDINVKFEIDFA
jgi:hypothetical protein